MPVIATIFTQIAPSQQYLRYRSIQLIINSIGAIGAALPKVSLLYCSIPACYCYNISTKQYLIRNITSKHILCYFYTNKRQILLFFLIIWGALPPTPPNMNIDHVCVWFTYFFWGATGAPILFSEIMLTYGFLFVVLYIQVNKKHLQK